QRVGDFDGHSPQLVVESFAVGDVPLERILDADRDPLGVELELAGVDAARAVAEHRPDAARNEAAEISVAERGEIAHRLDAGTPQALFGLRSDAREAPHCERREERSLPPWRYDDEPARLTRIARDFGDDLARRNTERAREARPRAHCGLHRLGHHSRRQEVACHLSDIEVALVDSRLLDGGNDAAHRVPHAAGMLTIERVPRPHEDGLRTAAERLGAAHRGVDPEPARDVVRGRDDAAPTRIAAYDER